jgi:hypothetical protein
VEVAQKTGVRYRIMIKRILEAILGKSELSRFKEYI